MLIYQSKKVITKIVVVLMLMIILIITMIMIIIILITVIIIIMLTLTVIITMIRKIVDDRVKIINKYIILNFKILVNPKL